MTPPNPPYVERVAGPETAESGVENPVIDFPREEDEFPTLLRQIALRGIVGAVKVA
jgi:hypothetical protein